MLRWTRARTLQINHDEKKKMRVDKKYNQIKGSNKKSFKKDKIYIQGYIGLNIF